MPLSGELPSMFVEFVKLYSDKVYFVTRGLSRPRRLGGDARRDQFVGRKAG